MKKIFLLIVLIPSFCFSQDTTNLTMRNVYDDVKDGFEKLVSSLEGPAKHTYEIYVRQQQIEAWSYLAATFVCLILSLSLLKICMKKADFDEGNIYAAGATAGVILGIAFIVMSICFFTASFFSQITNPEYWAIQEIVKTLKQ